jgi:hypothetical protein
MSSNTFGFVFFMIFAAVIATFAYRIEKHGGFKSAMFGSRIERTVGEVRGTEKRLWSSVKLRINVLSADSEDHGYDNLLRRGHKESRLMQSRTGAGSSIDEGRFAGALL